MNNRIAQVVLGLPVEGPFDYFLPEAFRDKVKEGQRVYVSFAFRKTIGYVIGLQKQSPIKNLKPVLALLDELDPALSATQLTLAKTFSDYYGCSWGEAIESSLPAVLRRKTVSNFAARRSDEVPQHQGETILCHDQQGDGRWPFVLNKIKDALARGRGVIVLVPEMHLIGNVKSMIERACAVIAAVIDKKLKPSEELEQWTSIKNGTSRVVVGTRSAVFAPVDQLGLIVMDEEDNSAYKQEQSPRYHTRDVVFMRQELEGCNVVFSSSCPSPELWGIIKKKKISVEIFLNKQWADTTIVDLANYKPRKGTYLSYPMINHIEEALANDGKVVVFFNRKGPQEETRNDQIKYFYPPAAGSDQERRLRNWQASVVKVEADLKKFFPYARVARFDQESARFPEEANVIVATQAVVKHLRRIHPRLLAVLAIDSELNRFDFHSAHRVFSLLMHFRQVAQKKLVIQTYQPQEYTLASVGKADFAGFYQQELKHRRNLGFPPYQHFISIQLRGKKEDVVADLANQLYAALSPCLTKQEQIFDPQAVGSFKLRKQYRFSIMLKTVSVEKLIKRIRPVIRGFKNKKGVIVTINVDP